MILQPSASLPAPPHLFTSSIVFAQPPVLLIPVADVPVAVCVPQVVALKGIDLPFKLCQVSRHLQEQIWRERENKLATFYLTSPLLQFCKFLHDVQIAGHSIK